MNLEDELQSIISGAGKNSTRNLIEAAAVVTNNGTLSIIHTAYYLMLTFFENTR